MSLTLWITTFSPGLRVIISIVFHCIASMLNIKIAALYMTNDVGKEILKYIQNESAKKYVSVQIYFRPEPFFDLSSIIIIILATFTVGISSYGSALKERRIYAQIKVSGGGGSSSSLNASQNKSRNNRRARTENENGDGEDPNRIDHNSVNISTSAAGLFLVAGSGMLVLLFYFSSYLLSIVQGTLFFAPGLRLD